MDNQFPISGHVTGMRSSRGVGRLTKKTSVGTVDEVRKGGSEGEGGGREREGGREGGRKAERRLNGHLRIWGNDWLNVME